MKSFASLHTHPIMATTNGDVSPMADANADADAVNGTEASGVARVAWEPSWVWLICQRKSIAIDGCSMI